MPDVVDFFIKSGEDGFVFISFDLAVFGQIDRCNAQSEQKQGSGKNPAEFFVETERASRPSAAGEKCRQQQSGQYGQRNRVDVGNFYPCVDGVDFGVKRAADFAEFFSFGVQTFANAGNQGQFVRSKGLPPFKVFFAPDFLKFGFGSIDAFDDFVLFNLKVKLRVASDSFDVFKSSDLGRFAAQADEVVAAAQTFERIKNKVAVVHDRHSKVTIQQFDRTGPKRIVEKVGIADGNKFKGAVSAAAFDFRGDDLRCIVRAEVAENVAGVDVLVNCRDVEVCGVGRSDYQRFENDVRCRRFDF